MTQSPSRLKWLLALAVGIVLWHLTAIIAGLITLAIAGTPEAITGLMLVPYSIIRAGLGVLGIALALRLANQRLPDVGLRSDHWQADALIGIVAGVAWTLVELFVLIPLTGGAARSDVVASLNLVGDSAWGLLGVIFVGWVVGGLSEELFFRGHLIHTLRGLLGHRPVVTAIAVAISVIYFGLTHAYQGWVGILDVGAGALLWSALYLWRGRRLMAPIIAHGLFDTLVILGVYAFYSG